MECAWNCATRVLITGGSGFVGRHLVPRLTAAGAYVTVLTRNPGRSADVLPGVDLVADPVAAASREPNVIINLAGAGIGDRPWSEASPFVEGVPYRLHPRALRGFRGATAGGVRECICDWILRHLGTCAV